jgi:hypothetical protein
MEPGDIHNGAIGGVLARNPFGVDEREGTGLDGKFHFGAVDAARGVAQVDFQFYWLLGLRLRWDRAQ